MEEREKLAAAKKYLDDLANGVDPLTGRILPEDSGVNNVRVSRCLFYVSSVLEKVIENGGRVGARVKKPKKLIFSLSQTEKDAIEITETPVLLADFVERVNANVDLNVMKKVSAKAFTDWMIANGILEEKFIKDKNRKFPTLLGNNLGVITEERQGLYGKYVAILYTKTAQEFLVDNLDEIVQAYYG